MGSEDKMEQFRLKWNNFQDNVLNSISKLRDTHDYTDVTLACDEDREFQAHKIILSASSPYFLNMFKKTNHPQPFVFLRGLKSRDLEAILEFVYSGECSMDQAYLNNFLILAEELQIKGLSGTPTDWIQVPDSNLKKYCIKL